MLTLRLSSSQRRTAALYQLHRALVTSPSSLPDTIFGLTIEDSPFGASMSYSRPVDAYRRPAKPDARSFPMPHFVWWAWDLSFVGGMTRAMREVDAIEAEHAHRGKRKGRLGWWETKDRRAVWRGTTWFSSAQTPNMRGKLIQATKGKDWADVQALNWTHETAASSGRARPSSQSKEAKEATNALPISDFCRHRYIIYTEGVTYSGRLQLHQLCASVVLSPPIAWMQHTSHLIRPVFSSDLLAAQGRADGLVPDTHVDNNSTYPTARHRASWPSAATARSANDANMVFVAPDWSDLEATVAWLEEHPAVAAGIARRQRELFVGGGYFSAAAEACYWRGLIRGWAKVVRTGEETDDSGKGKREWPEGTPFEEWIMKDGNV